MKTHFFFALVALVILAPSISHATATRDRVQAMAKKEGDPEIKPRPLTKAERKAYGEAFDAAYRKYALKLASDPQTDWNTTPDVSTMSSEDLEHNVEAELAARGLKYDVLMNAALNPMKDLTGATGDKWKKIHVRVYNDMNRSLMKLKARLAQGGKPDATAALDYEMNLQTVFMVSVMTKDGEFPGLEEYVRNSPEVYRMLMKGLAGVNTGHSTDKSVSTHPTGSKPDTTSAPVNGDAAEDQSRSGE